MTTRSLVVPPMLVGALALVAGCHGSTSSVPLPSADSAAIMAKAHSGTASAGQVERPAVYVGAAGVSPHPASTGETVVQFVVDSTGAIQPSTFKVVRVHDLTMVEDAKRVLRRWHYTPAEIGGRKVSQLVQTAIER
jgi:hypothetical protein